MKIRSASLSIKEKPKVAQGSWGGFANRSRKGLHYYSDLYTGSDAGYEQGYRSNRFLSDGQLWEVYRRCSDVRAAVDAIVRRVATFDWVVEPIRSPQEEGYDDLVGLAKEATSFLAMPNKNGETWQEIMTAFLTDVLIYDRGAIEIVYDRGGKLTELVPLRGSTIEPVVNDKGRILAYEQSIFAEETSYTYASAQTTTIKFTLNQMLFFNLYPNTTEVIGNPLIEALINEVIALMRASEHAMLALDADEIPQGILVLAGISGRAAEEAKADMQRLKGQDHKIRVMTTPDPNGVGAKWLELRRTPKDISMRELIDDIRRAVYRTFGVMPVEMGMTDGVPRATAVVQLDVSSSHLVTPILELLQSKVNSRILPLLLGENAKFLRFRFDREARLNPEDAQKLSSKHQTYVRNGIMTRNEVREELGLPPIAGGDVATMEVAGMPTPVHTLGDYNSVLPVESDDIGGDLIVPVEPAKPSDQFEEEVEEEAIEEDENANLDLE